MHYLGTVRIRDLPCSCWISFKVHLVESNHDSGQRIFAPDAEELQHVKLELIEVHEIAINKKIKNGGLVRDGRDGGYHVISPT